MIRDIIDSLKDNIIKRVKNPFLGTFTVVFILKNWELFYSLLVFDQAENRISRIETITQYINDAGGSFWMLIWAAIWTLVILSISYIFFDIGIFLSNSNDSIIKPWILKLISKGTKIVSIEDHRLLEKKYQDVSDQLKEEKKKRFESDREKEAIEKEFATYKATKEKEFEDLQALKIQTTNPRTLNSISEELFNSFNKETAKSEEEKILDDIIKKGWESYFIQLCNSIDVQDKVVGNINIDFENYLIFKKVVERYRDFQYEFTELGDKIRDLFEKR